MKQRDVYLSIGTNLGDREANIARALSLLDKYVGRHWSALSSIVETPAWGFDGQAFLNCAVCYRTGLSPFTLLDICKRIEREMGRRETIEYASDGSRVYQDRIIDIDILLCGDEVVDTPRLRIPHPLMSQRDFVKIPLSEILTGK